MNMPCSAWLTTSPLVAAVRLKCIPNKIDILWHVGTLHKQHYGSNRQVRLAGLHLGEAQQMLAEPVVWAYNLRMLIGCIDTPAATELPWLLYYVTATWL
jgi:hypothetical protein